MSLKAIRITVDTVFSPHGRVAAGREFEVDEHNQENANDLIKIKKAVAIDEVSPPAPAKKKRRTRKPANKD